MQQSPMQTCLVIVHIMHVYTFFTVISNHKTWFYFLKMSHHFVVTFRKVVSSSVGSSLDSGSKYLEFNFKGTALTVKQLQKGRGGGQ